MSTRYRFWASNFAAVSGRKLEQFKVKLSFIGGGEQSRQLQNTTPVADWGDRKDF
jgi:hypothetical protein